MLRITSFFFVLFSCAALAACSSTGADSGATSPDGGDAGGDAGLDAAPDAPTSCTTRNDCGEHQLCAYDVAKGCAATTGTCIEETGGGACDAGTSVVCGCDGRSQSVGNLFCGLPPGYIFMPVLHDGPCAGDDGGDAGDAGDGAP